MSPALQGFLINFELNCYGGRDRHQRAQGQAALQSSGFGTARRLRTLAAFAGGSRLGVIICLSQSKRNG